MRIKLAFREVKEKYNVFLLVVVDNLKFAEIYALILYEIKNPYKQACSDFIRDEIPLNFHFSDFFLYLY